MLFGTVFLFEVYLAVCAPKPCSPRWVLARTGICTNVGVAIFMKSSWAIESPEARLIDLSELFLRTTPMLPVKSGSITSAFTSSS